MRISLVTFAIGTLSVAACGTGPTLPPNVLNVPFALQSVNGATVPAVVFDSANPAVRLDALSGTITIKSDTSFTDVTSFRQTINGVVTNRTTACTGTFVSVGLVFQFTETGPLPGCNRVFGGLVNGTSLNASVLGVPAVFSQ